MENDTNEILRFFLPMNPPTKTAQEKRWKCVNGKPIAYQSAELKAAYLKLRDGVARFKPEEKIRDSIQLLVQWGFPADKKHPAGSWRKGKPDTDNLQKMLKDVMTEVGFWEDDCLVVSETIQKFYVDTPGIYIVIAKATDKI